MTKKVKIENLSAELAKTLKDFAGATDAIVDQAVKETAKEAVQELKQAKPPGSGEYGDWKDYNKGWKITQTKTDKRYNRKATIHNATNYQLTHLLEKGHALVAGGRKRGNTRAFEHIAPVEEKAEERLMEKIKKGIKDA